MRYLSIAILLLSGIIVSCEEPFEPEINAEEQNLVVVEGELSDSTVIRLNLATPLNQDQIRAVSGASMRVINQSGTVVSDFQQINDQGEYYSPLQLQKQEKYRLIIEMPNGSTIQSDWVQLIPTPEIEDVYFEVAGGELEIFLDAALGEEKGFYRWNYEEAWQYFSGFYSNLIAENRSVRSRLPEEQIYECYKEVQSSSVVVSNTVGLEEDKVIRQSIKQINPANSMRLESQYTIKVTQRKISETAFEFWRILKENTESQGTIFDVQPSRLPVNYEVLNSDQGLGVVGYLSAVELRSTRIFIRSIDLPPGEIESLDPYLTCQEDTFPTIDRPMEMIYEGTVIPTRRVRGAYLAAGPWCVDCRENGGQTTKPDYWIY